MTKSEQLWVDQMKARVPALMAQGATLEGAVELAHEEMQAFLAEMWAGRTDRAKLFRAELAEQTWHTLRQQNAVA